MNCRINLRAGHGWGQKDSCRLTRRLTTTEGAAGQEPVIRFDRHAARDKLGRFGHVTGHAFIGRASFTTVAATMNAAMPGQLIYTILNQIQLTAGGRAFLVSVDGADLDDDMIIREGFRLGALPADLADADATPTSDITLVWTYGRPHTTERHGSRSLDCALPLSLFNMNADSEAGLRFLIDSAPRSGGGEVDAFPGVTSGGFITSGQELEIYSILRYEDELVVDVPWQVRRIAGPELTGRYVAGALTGYLVVRDRVNSTADASQWIPNHADYSTVEVTAGDEDLTKGQDGQTARVMARRANALTALGDDGFAASAKLLTAASPAYLPLIWPPSAARRASLANGDVSWTIGARTNHARTRVLMRGYGDYDVDFEIKARACTPGLGDVADQRQTSAASPSPKAASIGNFLPVAIREKPENTKAG